MFSKRSTLVLTNSIVMLKKSVSFSKKNLVCSLTWKRCSSSAVWANSLLIEIWRSVLLNVHRWRTLPRWHCPADEWCEHESLVPQQCSKESEVDEGAAQISPISIEGREHPSVDREMERKRLTFDVRELLFGESEAFRYEEEEEDDRCFCSILRVPLSLGETKKYVSMFFESISSVQIRSNTFQPCRTFEGLKNKFRIGHSNFDCEGHCWMNVTRHCSSNWFRSRIPSFTGMFRI